LPPFGVLGNPAPLARLSMGMELAKGAMHVSMSTISAAMSERVDAAHRERDLGFVAASCSAGRIRLRPTNSSSPQRVLPMRSSGSVRPSMRWDNEPLSSVSVN
jgi:hypothetical protein